MKSRGYVDIFKFIFCIFVVGIHTEVFNKLGLMNWYIVNCIFRLAVPFFFVCSGYFYVKKIYLYTHDEIKKYTINYIRRLIIPFFFWLFIGLILSEYKNAYNGDIVSTIILLLKKVVFYPWGALWYVLALIIAILLLSFFYSKKKYYLPIIIGSFLYIFALLCNSYYFVTASNSVLRSIIDNYMNIFISARNGIFVGLLFVAIGGIIYKMEYDGIEIFKNKKIIITIISLFCLIIEVSIVKMNCHQL